jgi:hypothetical protein
MTIFRVGDHPGYRSTGIPWAMIEPHAKQAMCNHDQTLHRPHQRGGLTWCEALAVLEDREWRPDPDAKTKILEMVRIWSEAITMVVGDKS